jgi:hypothetical protein
VDKELLPPLLAVNAPMFEGLVHQSYVMDFKKQLSWYMKDFGALL